MRVRLSVAISTIPMLLTQRKARAESCCQTPSRKQKRTAIRNEDEGLAIGGDINDTDVVDTTEGQGGELLSDSLPEAEADAIRNDDEGLAIGGDVNDTEPVDDTTEGQGGELLSDSLPEAEADAIRNEDEGLAIGGDVNDTSVVETEDIDELDTTSMLDVGDMDDVDLGLTEDQQLYSQALQQLSTFLYMVSTTLNTLNLDIQELIEPYNQDFPTANEGIQVEVEAWEDYDLLSISVGNEIGPFLLTGLLKLKDDSVGGEALTRDNTWKTGNALVGWEDENNLIIGAENAGTETFSIYGINLFGNDFTRGVQPVVQDVPLAPTGIGPPIDELPDFITVGATYFPWTWGLKYNYRASSLADLTQSGRWIAYTGSKEPLLAITPLSLLAMEDGSDEELRVFLTYNGTDLRLVSSSGQVADLDGTHTFSRMTFTASEINLIFTSASVHDYFTASTPSVFFLTPAGAIAQIEDTERTSSTGATVTYDISGNTDAQSVLNALTSGEEMNLAIASRNSIKQDSLRLAFGADFLGEGDDEVARALFSGTTPASGDYDVEGATITSLTYDSATFTLAIDTDDNTAFLTYFDNEGPSLYIANNIGELIQVPNQWRTSREWAIPDAHERIRNILADLSGSYLLVIAIPDTVELRSAWERVTGLSFYMSDADTQSRALFFEAEDFTVANKIIAAYRLNVDGNEDIVAFTTTGAFEKAGVYYYIPVERNYTFDRHSNFEVHPPADATYTMRLLLPFIYEYATFRDISAGTDGLGFETVFQRTQDECVAGYAINHNIAGRHG